MNCIFVFYIHYTDKICPNHSTNALFFHNDYLELDIPWC